MKLDLRKKRIALITFCLFLTLLITMCLKGGEIGTGVDLSSCQECHREIYAEWQDSMHALAWTDLMSLSEKAALAARGGEEGILGCLPSSISGSLLTKCLVCHASLPIQITGVGVLPSLREEGREEGITCITCHQDSNGAQHGPFESQAPHKTVKDINYTTAEICATCHATCPLGKGPQVDEWKNSSFSKRGITCQDCHMPKIDRRIAEWKVDLPVRRSGRHTWEGPHDEGMLKSAAAIEANVENDTVIIKIINNGTGHSIPGGGGRAVIADISILKKDGGEVLHEQEIFNVANENRIKADEVRILKYELPITHGEVKVKLLYKLFLNLPDDQAAAMAEAETTF